MDYSQNIVTGNKPLILWIHGFAGKPNNDNVCEMRKRFSNYDWFSIEVDHHALESMKKINDFINEYHPAIVAGTSLGGFYTMCADFDGPKFVVNPAINPLQELKQFLGINTYKPGRPDGQTDFEFTDEMRLEFGQLSMKPLDKVVCNYAPNDSVLKGNASKYEEMFTHVWPIEENILPDHFMTFKYVKMGLPKVLEYIETHF